ncbi:MAG TPA: ABC transporter permease [Gammaproteobacteria bacterium]|nr:ABC transporter permease [Gammaproteobacteria bacterium]
MNVARVTNFLDQAGLTWFAPVIRLCVGEDPKAQLKSLWMLMGVPLVAIVLFLGLWNVTAAGVQTSLGTIPGPAQVWREFRNLVQSHHEERAKARAFYERQRQRNAELLAKDSRAKVEIRPWTGKPTFFDQILTSLKTVFTGFLLASVVAVPLGILCGTSRIVMAALNPLIQVFKPVSPLAWLPIVTLIVSAAYASNDGWLPKSFIVSAVTVTLCSLWPTVINTAVGVASVDKDLINVARVLQLSWVTRIIKIIIPSSLPLIFTGLRLSLGVGWMVLIAAEMLAQNPGLGKFVWDEFQNGSSQSLARIMVAVLTIGLIGFLLDRLMLTAQQLFTYGERRT